MARNMGITVVQYIVHNTQLIITEDEHFSRARRRISLLTVSSKTEIRKPVHHQVAAVFNYSPNVRSQNGLLHIN